MHVLFEGSPRAVDAQVRALGGEEAEPWDELRALAGEAAGPGPLGRRSAARSCGRGRASPTSRSSRASPWSPLAERVLEAMCSPS